MHVAGWRRRLWIGLDWICNAGFLWCTVLFNSMLLGLMEMCTVVNRSKLDSFEALLQKAWTEWMSTFNFFTGAILTLCLGLAFASTASISPFQFPSCSDNQADECVLSVAMFAQENQGNAVTPVAYEVHSVRKVFAIGS